MSDEQIEQRLGSGRGGPGPPAAAPGNDRGRPAGRRFDPSNMTPEQLERIKERMRARGMSDEQIERRLRGDDDPAGPGAR